jgi:hypothetical protein
MKLKQILIESENPCWNGYKQVGMKNKGGKQVPNCVPESVQVEGIMSTIDQIKKDSKDVKDFIKKVLLDKDFKDMRGDRDFIKYLGSIYEGNVNSLDETMFIRIQDLAQKILPKDAFNLNMDTFKDADKVKERQSTMLKDLSASLNKFYKNYNLNIQVK